MRKIRVTVEVCNPRTTKEYEDLPDTWDEMTEPEHEEYLDALAMEALGNQAGSGAAVVEVDENGREVASSE